MGYSTEWIVIVFILAIVLAVGWQSYLAGHLLLYVGANIVVLGAGYLYNRLYDSKS